MKSTRTEIKYRFLSASSRPTTKSLRPVRQIRPRRPIEAWKVPHKPNPPCPDSRNKPRPWRRRVAFVRSLQSECLSNTIEYGGKLPDFIDSPQHRSSTWGRRRIISLTALALGVFVCGRIGLSYWVDLLWFQSLGYGEVFWKSVGLQIADFVVFAGTTFLILYGAFSAIRRSHEADLPRAHSIVIAGQPISLSVQPVLRVISFCISIVIACVTGLALMAELADTGAVLVCAACNGQRC